MDTAESGPFNQSQHPWYRPRTVALPLPTVAYRNGKLTVDITEMSSSCNVGECIASQHVRHPVSKISIVNYVGKSILSYNVNCKNSYLILNFIFLYFLSLLFTVIASMKQKSDIEDYRSLSKC